jgi:plasmid maintenance system antidote protein VapI
VPLGKTDKLPNLPGKYVKENWKRQRKVSLKAVARAIELTCGTIIDLTGHEAPFFVATHITDPVQDLL